MESSQDYCGAGSIVPESAAVLASVVFVIRPRGIDLRLELHHRFMGINEFIRRLYASEISQPLYSAIQRVHGVVQL